MFKARHSTPSEMLLESLDEFLFSAYFSLNYRKRDEKQWPKPHVAGGILGFSTTLLLFSIVDAIGSFYENSEIKIGKNKFFIKAKENKTHLYILNSDLFGLDLNEVDFDQIYFCLRNKIVHNSLIGKEILLKAGKNTSFIKVNSFRGKGRYTIYLNSFYDACENAIAQFKIEIPRLVPNSTHGKDFFEKE